jgi:Putative prokaryotic signal transducing protein
MSSSTGDPPLGCPSCDTAEPGDGPFCASCGTPLVLVGGEPLDAPLSEAHGRARKIDPSYTQGRLVRVAGGRNQPEAELIQGLLLEEGVPSVLRRTAGFDVPDFLAAGPRDVMVPEAGAEVARALLRDLRMGAQEPEPGSARGPHPLVLIAGVLGTGAVAALVAYLSQ